MKKNNLLIFGIIAVAGYFAWKKGFFGKKSEKTEPTEPGTETETPDEETKSEPKAIAPGTSTTPPTTVINTGGNTTVEKAIEQAKDIVKKYENIRVLIKTPKGKKNISVENKKAKKKRKAKRKTQKSTSTPI